MSSVVGHSLVWKSCVRVCAVDAMGCVGMWVLMHACVCACACATKDFCMAGPMVWRRQNYSSQSTLHYYYQYRDT